MSLIKEKLNKVFSELKPVMNYKNSMQAPRIKKVVISTGIGSVKDKKKIEIIEDRLTKITGQKPAKRGAKISIANFKVRQGEAVGFQVTLRGKRMMDFLDRFLSIALPRSKDFKGISPKAIDDVGNLTIGVKEHTIFPETPDEDLKDVFGLAVTIVATTSDKKEAKLFFEKLGVPFKKA